MWQLRDIRLQSSYAYHKSHVAWLIVFLVGSVYVNVPAWEYSDCNLIRIFDPLVVDLSHFPPSSFIQRWFVDNADLCESNTINGKAKRLVHR